jgi:hypothetical protein
MLDVILLFAVFIAFALTLLRSMRHIRRRHALDEAAAEFLRANGASSMAELRAKVEASREKHRYAGPSTGLRDVSSFAEGRKVSWPDRPGMP